MGIGFPEYIYVQGSLYPEGNLHQIGNPVQCFIEGHFVSVYADNLEVGDGSGGTRRVLLEGSQTDYKSLGNKPVVVVPGYLPPIALTTDTQEPLGASDGQRSVRIQQLRLSLFW